MPNNEIQIFKNEEFGEVWATIINGLTWFAGKDVTRALGYSNSRKAIQDHVDDEDKGVTKRDTLGGRQSITIINESGLYALIFGSKLESAKRFKHWVTAEVLPAIRKTGTYSMERETSNLTTTKQQEQKLAEGDARALAYNRGVVLGVLRQELEEDSTLEIYERLSVSGKGMVMKLIFGEVHHAQ